MVNTRIDAELSAIVQNALPTLLPQIYAEIREEFRTGNSSRGRGELDLLHEKIFDVMGCEDAFKTRLPVQKSGDRHQPTTQQSSHRNHGHNNDRHGSDRRGGGDNHRSSNNNYSGNNNRSFDNGRDQRNRGQQSNRPVNSSNSPPGVRLRATPTRSALCVDADTQESVVELLVPAS
nr:hypothetical protein [Tanacetum cinerariifolium]